MKYRAVVIGINGYSGGIAPLETAVGDARAIGRLLAEKHGYEVTELLDGAADRFAIEELVAYELPDAVDEETALVFYFAGHGVAEDRGDGTPRGFLLPHDAGRDKESWIEMEKVHRHLDELACHHLLVILDCCFAGSFRWAQTRNIVAVGERLFKAQLERFRRHPARQLLTSAAHDEKAMDSLAREAGVEGGVEGRSAGHSPFAAALIEGLGGAADSERAGFEPDGVMTATELYQFLDESLHRAEAPQTPGLSSLRRESRGEFVFEAPGHEEHEPRENPELRNPWLGLEPYARDDEAHFFGRSAEVENLVARVVDPEQDRLVVLTGPSGAGKTSLLCAGLVPALEALESNWRVELIERLDRCDPLEAIEAAARVLLEMQDGERRLLVIDAFEQVFGRCSLETRDRLFERLLSFQDAGLRLLVSVRSDFEPQLAARRAFGDSLRRATLALGPPSLDGLRRIVEGPAEQVALHFDPPELVERIVGEVHGMPGALPLLSFALSRIFIASVRRRLEDGPDLALTEADYEAIGGVAGALHREANRLYDAAEGEPDKQALMRWIFLRLVSDEGGHLSRRRVAREELEPALELESKTADAVIEDFRQAGLLRADEESVEPAHDALVLAWPRLRRWLDEEGSQQLWRQLWSAAVAWRDHSGTRREKRGLLWTEDPRLGLFYDLRGWWSRWRRQAAGILGLGRTSTRRRRRDAREQRLGRRGKMNALESSFISAAVRETRHRRAWRTGLGLAVTLTLLGFSIFSWRQMRIVAELNHRGCLAFTYLVEAGHLAEAAEEAARRNFRAATARVLLEEGRPQLAGLVALEIGPTEQADATSRRALHDVLAATGGHLLGPAPQRAEHAAWLAARTTAPQPGRATDEEKLPVESKPASKPEPKPEENSAPGEAGETPTPPDASATSPPITPSAVSDIDIEALALPDGLRGDVDPARLTAVLDDAASAHVVAAFGERLRIWDRATGLQLAELRTPTDVLALAWSPQRDRLYTRTRDGTVEWAVDAALVQGVIRAGSRSCLSRRQRERHLRESEEEARERAEKCEECLPDFFAMLELSNAAAAMQVFQRCTEIETAEVAPFAEILRCPE